MSEWTAPSDWPDIKTILTNDTTAGYSGKLIYLIDAGCPTSQFVGGAAYRTSDGSFYTADTTHTWDNTKDFTCSRGYSTRWVTVYLNTDTINTTIINNIYNLNPARYFLWMVFDCTINAKLYNNILKCHQICESVETINNKIYVGGDAQSFVNDFTQIKKVPNSTQTGNNYNLFSGCVSLREITNTIDVSNSTNLSLSFTGCFSLNSITSVIDMNSITNSSDVPDFTGCYNLVHILISNASLNLNLSDSPLLSRESMLYLFNNAKTVTGKTLTLGAINLAKLTTEEKAIATNKGWTLA